MSERAAGARTHPRDADDRVAAAVRRLDGPDAGELLTLQLAAWVQEAHDNETLQIPPLLESLDDVRAQLADEQWTIWGLRQDGRLVATVRSRLLAVDVAYVGRLGVVPDLQGHGLGGAMLRHVESTLPGSVRRIELLSGRRSFGNHAFYRRRGYELRANDDSNGTVLFVKDVPGSAASHQQFDDRGDADDDDGGAQHGR